MAATIRRLHFHDGSIRLGPEHFAWCDPYTRSLSFEVKRVNVAVIGGLTLPRLSSQERDWIEAAMIAEGLRMAMWRCKKGRERYFVLLAMPHWPRGKRVLARKRATRSKFLATP